MVNILEIRDMARPWVLVVQTNDEAPTNMPIPHVVHPTLAVSIVVGEVLPGLQNGARYDMCAYFVLATADDVQVRERTNFALAALSEWLCSDLQGLLREHLYLVMHNMHRVHSTRKI